MNKQRKTIITVVILLLISLAGGLYYKNTQSAKNNSATKDKVVTEQVNPNQDKALTEKIVKENIVLNGQAYEDDDMIIGTMIIKKGATQEQIKAIVEKYATDLKAKYKDKQVNVQAVQGNKNVANVTK